MVCKDMKSMLGKRVNQIDYKEGKQGEKIKLTIDTEVQKLSKELQGQSWINKCDGYIYR